MIMYRFLVVIEKVNNNYSAYSPDLPGCVSTGATREEAEKNMYEAIEMHIQGLLEDNLAIPESKSFAEYMAVAEKSSIGQMA
jgi:predicted RNase H-like HicB family nuclease